MLAVCYFHVSANTKFLGVIVFHSHTQQEDKIYFTHCHTEMEKPICDQDDKDLEELVNLRFSDTSQAHNEVQTVPSLSGNDKAANTNGTPPPPPPARKIDFTFCVFFFVLAVSK